jgi:hypothetical protein
VEAVSLVATNEGGWNWVFLAADARSLPLVGGGGGGPDEMRECLITNSTHAILFGLLRLSYGVSGAARNRFVLLVASDHEKADVLGDAAKKRSAVAIGLALSERGRMEQDGHSTASSACCE